MKNILYLFLILSISFGCFSSCTLETSDNGKLDGLWHLCYIDSMENGQSSDLCEQYYYWAFSFKLLSIRETTTCTEYLLQFKRNEDSLLVYEPYKYLGQGEDSLLIDAKELLPFGITNLTESYKVIELSNRKMVLQNSRLRLRFRKL